jgi:uncharacterized membrane protein YhaH (DUF805 family)
MTIDFQSLLCTFQGRINRAKYWIAAVIYVAAMLIAGLLSFVLGFGVLWFVVGGVIYIAVVISGIAVGIKRLHDRDKSGWWLLVFYVGPSVLGGLGTSTGFQVVFAIASFALALWAFVELGCLRGTAGANQYGPDSLAS